MNSFIGRVESDADTGKLALVPVLRCHARDMFHVLADPELYHFTGGMPPESAEAVHRWFSGLETRKSPDGTEHWLTWIVQLRERDTSIGYVQATIRGARAEIAWLIGTPWQGRGYAREAVALLKSWLTRHDIEELTAHIHPRHRASQRVALSAGFLHNGAIHNSEEVWTAPLVANQTTSVQK